ncbi:GIP, partial [Symbiodinium necroappetens]
DTADNEEPETDGRDEENDVFQIVADQIQGQPDYDEEDALDVLETYQDIRRKMQQKKVGRGFRSTNSTWSLSGRVKGRLEQLKQKTKCFTCQQTGHWKRECPRRKGGHTSSSGQASSTKDAMIADGGDDEAKEGEFFIPTDQIDALDVFLVEGNQGDVDIVVAGKDELECADVSAALGDLDRERLLFQNFCENAPDADSLSDAYMAESGGLGVMNEPDVTQKMQVKTHEVMSYLPEDINMGAPVETFTRTPLIDSLLQEVGPQLEIGQHELPAATLDQMSDKEEDAPDGLVHGLSGRTIFNIGKYMKTGRAVSFEIAYQTDKAY